MIFADTVGEDFWEQITGLDRRGKNEKFFNPFGTYVGSSNKSFSLTLTLSAYAFINAQTHNIVAKILILVNPHINEGLWFQALVFAAFGNGETVLKKCAMQNIQGGTDNGNK